MRFTPSMPSERPRDFYAAWGPNDHVMVGEVDGRVVGFAGLHVRDGKRRHYGLARHRRARRVRAAAASDARSMTTLVELADNWIGLVRVDLEADAGNERAIAMYRHFGFVEEGRQKKAYFSDGTYTDAVLMARLR